MEKKPDILARLILFLLAFLFAGSFAVAQENANRAAHTIRAGFPVIAGFGHINEDGTYSGYNYDYLQKLAQHTGWKYEFVPCTWDECIKMLDNGEIDLLGGIQRTPAREKQFRFAELESFLNYNVLLARANDQRFQDKNLDELGTLTVGALKGRYETVLFRKYARRYHIRYRLITYDSPADMQRAMENGDIDILLSSSISKVNGMRILATFAPSPLFYAVRKDNKKLLDELDMAQSILKSHDPFFDFRLYEKHYGFNETNLPTLTRAERDALKKNPVLRVGCIEGWRPFSYSGHEGIVTDMLSYIANHTGIDIRYVDLPSHEAAYQKLQDGEIDAVGFAETDSSVISLRNLKPTTAFLQVPVVRVAMAGRAASTPIDRVALTHYANDHLLDELRKQHPNIEIVYKDSPHQIFDALIAGEIDAGYVNVYSANALMSWPEYSSLALSETAPHTAEFSVVFAPGINAQIVSVFNKYIRQLRNYKLHEFTITHIARQPKRNLFTLIRERPALAFYGFACILILTIGFFTSLIIIRNRAHKRITGLLFFDQLTGLPNLVRFSQDATRLLQHPTAGKQYSLVYININNFKYINDIHDFSKGNDLLRTVAGRLKTFIHPERGEMVCRQSADHFILLLASPDQTSLRQRIDELNTALAGLNRAAGNYHVTFSCGIYQLRPGDTIDAAINYAHYAQFSKSKASYNTYTWFDNQTIAHIRDNRRIEQEMNQALANGQFVPYFQPKVDMKTGAIVGAEALARWITPEHGIISPERFIDLFEKNNFIIQLDLSIFEQTCRILKKRQDEGKAVLPVSCNFSHNHFTDLSLPGKLTEIARRYGITTALLDIEITETSVINDIDTVIEATRQLRHSGFKISLDDFGVGYSSVNLLCQIDVDTIKIDKSFLEHASILPCKRNLIEGIVAIADSLGIDILCEGVETQQQIDFLTRAGCTLAQGYYYGRPVPFDEFARL